MQNFRYNVLKILQKLNTPLAYAIISAVFGLALLLLPRAALVILFAALGGVFVALGIVGIVAAAADEHTGIFQRLNIIKYALLTVAGASLIFRGAYLFIPFSRVLGGGVLLWSGVHLRNIYHTKDKGGISFYIDTILTAFLTVMGAILLLTPHLHYIFAGATLLLLSVKLFFDLYRRGKPAKEKRPDESGVYYVDEFVDKSDE